MKLLLSLVTLLGITINSYSQCTLTTTKKDVTCRGGSDGEIELKFQGWNCDFPTPTSCSTPVVAPENYCSKYATASGTDVTVNNGQGLCLPSGFNGNVILNGGTLVVCSTATIQNISFLDGTLIVVGSANIPNLNANGINSKIYVYGSLSSNSITCAGKLYNHGTLTVLSDLNINSNSYFENTGTTIANQSFNNNAVVINKGSIVVKNTDLKNNSGARFDNYCTVKVGLNSTGQFHNNSVFNNYGYIFSYNLSTLNSGGTINMFSSSVFETKNIQNYDGVISASNATCSQLKISGSATFNSNARITGKIGVCGISLTSLPTGVVGTGVTEGCTCVQPYIPVSWKFNGTSLSASNNKITNLQAGTYTFAANCGGCSSNQTITISQPAQALQATVYSANTSGVGKCDGYASVTVSGAQGAHTIKWSTGSTTNTVSLCKGIYSVTITDSKGCSVQKSVTIGEGRSCSSPISVAKTVVGESCITGGDGSIQIQVNGGSQNRMVAWNVSSSNPYTVSSLKKGSYNVKIVDENGCFYQEDITVPGGSENIQVSAATTPTKYKQCTGSITLTGQSSYSYLWDDNTSSSTKLSACAGYHAAWVTNSQGCKKYIPVVVSVDNNISPSDITTTVTPPFPGYPTGVVSIDVPTSTIGAIIPTTTTPVITPTVQPTCTRTISGSQNVIIEAGEVVCIEQNTTFNGAITVKEGATLIVNGTYTGETLTVETNAKFINNGQTTVATVISKPTSYIENNSTMTINTASIAGTLVNNAELITTKETIEATGTSINNGSHKTENQTVLGTATNNGKDIIATQNVEGIYKNTATTIVTATTIAATGKIVNTGSYSADKIVGNQSSQLISESELTAKSITGSPIITIKGVADIAQLDISATKVTLINAVVTIKDITTNNVAITTPSDSKAVLKITDSQSANNSTVNGPTITNIVGPGITLDPSVVKKEGNFDVTQIFFDGKESPTKTITSVPAGTHELTIIVGDKTVTKIVTVEDPISNCSKPIVITEKTIVSESCVPGNDGEIQSTVTGGSGVLDIKWYLSNKTGASIVGLSAGEYSMLVEDHNGCYASRKFTVKKHFAPTVAITTTNAHLNKNDGSISLSIVASSGTYSIVWDNYLDNTTPNLTNIPAGVYSVTVKSSTGCNVIKTIKVAYSTVITADDIVSVSPATSPTDKPDIVIKPIDITPLLIKPNISGEIPTDGNESKCTKQISGTANVVIKAGEVACIAANTEQLGNIVVETGAELIIIGKADVTSIITEEGSKVTIIGPAKAETYVNKGTTEVKGKLETEVLTSPGKLINGGDTKAETITAADVDNTGTVSADNIKFTDQTPTSPAVVKNDGIITAKISIDISDVEVIDNAKISAPQITTDTNITLGPGATIDAEKLTVKDDATITGPPSSSIPAIVTATVIDDQTSTTTPTFKDNVVVKTDTPISDKTPNVVVTPTTTPTVNSKIEIISPTGETTVVNPVNPTSVPVNPGETKVVIHTPDGQVITVPITTSAYVPMQLSATTKESNCVPSGAIELNVTKGLPPYTYLWQGVSETNKNNKNLSEIAGGNYSVTVTDNGGNSIYQTITVTEINNNISIDVKQVSTSCAQGATGSATATVSGAVGQPLYAWSSADASAQANNLNPGVYTVTVTDPATSCKKVGTVTIESKECQNQCANFSAIAKITSKPSCAEAADGAVGISVYGGRGNYYISSESTKLEGLSAGTYSYEISEVIDNNMCITTCSVTLDAQTVSCNEPCKAKSFSFSKKDATCPGANNGSLTINTGDADMSKYSVSWEFGSALSASNLAPRYYSAVIVNNEISNCAATIEATIFEPKPLIVYGDVYELCPGDILAFSTNYSNVNWEGSNIKSVSGNQMLTLTAGTYTVSAADYPSCSNLSVSFKVSNRPYCPSNALCEPIETITVPTESSCTVDIQNTDLFNAQYKYDRYIEMERKRFRDKYIAACLASQETLTMETQKGEFHNTLYYYDLAGNLVKTIPPAGVNPLSESQLSSVASERANNLVSTLPNHTYPSVYTYNSLNQLIAQNIPDHDPIQNKYSDPNIFKNGLDGNASITSITTNADGTATLCGFDAQNNGVIYSTTKLGSEWKQISTATKEDLHAVQMLNNGTIYAVGNRGTFVKSIDNGKNWDNVSTGTYTNFKFIHFSDVNNGLLIDGDANYIATTDGGKTWSLPARFNLPRAIDVTDMEFVSNTDWYIAFNKFGTGKIYRSLNAGASWTSVLENNVQPVNITDISMVDNALGFAVGKYGTILKTTDGAKSWSIVPSSTFDAITNVRFISANVGFIRLANGSFSISTDGAATWKPFLSDVSSPVLGWNINSNSALGLFFTANAVLLTNGSNLETTQRTITINNTIVNNITAAARLANNIAVGTDDGKVYVSSDDGLNWIEFAHSSINSTQPIKNIAISGEHFITVQFSDLGVYTCSETTNTELQHIFTWTKATVTDAAGVALNTAKFTNTNFISSVEAYALVKDASAIFKSTDNGATWIPTQTLINTSNTILIDENSPYVFSISSAGALLKASKGSNDWANITATQTSKPISGIAVSSSIIAACGPQSNLIIKSGAGPWKQQAVSSSGQLTDLTISGSTIHVIGMNYFTMDGSNGSVWEKKYVENNADLFDISNDFIVGAGYISPDKPQNISNTTFYAVAQLSSSKAVAVGQSGAIWLYNGSSWTSATEVQTPKLNKIVSVQNTSYAVGNNGTVLKSSNNGSTWTKISIANNTADLTMADFFSPELGIVAGQCPNILYTTNGGNSFVAANVPPAANGQTVTAIKMFSAKNILLTTSGGLVLYSTNGGSSWTEQTVAAQSLTALAYPTATLAYVAGAGGTVYKAAISGGVPQAWTSVSINEASRMQNSSPVTEDIAALFFSDEFIGYALTKKGLIVKTTEGGIHWTTDNDLSPKTNSNTLIPLGNQSFVAAGDAGSVVKVQDDAGRYTSRFWYDELGRLIISQNAQQFTQHKYSYTVYDLLGRTVEVGQVETNTIPPASASFASQVTRSEFNSWLGSNDRDQITRTQYDVALSTVHIAGFEQLNLRNRVASVLYYPKNGADYSHATHYSYDVHGNVSALVQDMPALAADRYKRLDYTYDLVSNKVTKVVYQAAAPDQFAHRYSYDGDNRLLAVETSTDLLLWNTDARYTYYRHGPLARIDVGNGLQSFDYAYTLQGWIKQVNNPLATADANSLNDEFAYSLGYFAGDYQPINPQATAPQQPSANGLYNGNISSMVTTIDKLGAPQAMSYQYDQLNRLVASTSHQYKEQQWTANNSYNEQLSYDANGNILTLQRNAPDAVVANTTRSIDNLTYNYYNQQYSNGRNTNRLRRVADAVSNSGYPTDLRSQADEDNYRYDPTGNLLQDKQEEIQRIDWTLSGKIAAVERVAGSQKADLAFEYDALGNRTAKHLTPKLPNGTPNPALRSSTFYVRDAQGNLMATYTRQGTDAALQLDEQPIYGSSRLGVFRPVANTHDLLRGSRVYEASNHLGNVLLTFSDRKVAQGDGSYKVDVTSASDYYAFGLEQYNRTIQPTEYAFGFNSQMKTPELGAGHTTALYWEYDGRLGRRWNLDPEYKKQAAKSAYLAFSNNPLIFVDPNGNTDYYNMKGSWIGTDGQQNDKVLVIADKAVQNQIIRTSETGQDYTQPINEGEKVFNVPTGNVLRAVQNTVNNTTADKKEHGGHSNRGSNSATEWDAGSSGNFEGKEFVAKITPFQKDGEDILPDNAENVEFWWHVHPNDEKVYKEAGMENQTVRLGFSTPSPADIKFQKKMTNRPLNFGGNSFVIGARSQNVTFFNATKELGTMKYQDFQKAGNKTKEGKTYEKYQSAKNAENAK